MSLLLAVELLPEHVREATEGVFRLQLAQPMVLLGAVGLLLLCQGLLWVVLPHAGWRLHGMLFLLMVFSLLVAAVVAGRHFQGLALRNFQRFAGQPAQVRLDELAYHYQASWGQGSIEWARFDSLWKLSKVWVLLQHQQDGVSVLLPTEALNQDAQVFILRKMAERGAQVLGS
ncbi:MAG TPA: hypothetical protein VK842_10875 [bacterium]|nr:hypothetical protein [bacterium]